MLIVHSSDHGPLTFETSAREGAVLVMPNGATSQNLRNTLLLKEYIRQNAEHWYKYTTSTLGRQVENGDIRIVVGCDKVLSWGIGTVANSTGERARLEFKSNDSSSHGSTTFGTWNCRGAVNGRVGPHPEEMRDLRAETNAPIRNQCTFVHTMNATLSEGTWNEITTLQIQPGSGDLPDSTPNSPRKRSSGKTAQSTSRSIVASPSVQINETELDLPVSQYNFFHSMHKDRIFYQVEHPSKLLNQRLMQKASEHLVPELLLI